MLFKSLFSQWKPIDKEAYIFLHVHYDGDACCNSGRLVKTSTISTSVMDPNKTYNFVAVKDSILQVDWSNKQIKSACSKKYGINISALELNID